MDTLTRPFIDEDGRLEHALELAAFSFGYSSLEFAATCLDLSDVYASTNMNLNRATVLAQHALSTRTVLLGQHDAATAIAASRLAILLHMTNRHAEAQNVETFANESVEAVCENTGANARRAWKKVRAKVLVPTPSTRQPKPSSIGKTKSGVRRK